MATRRDPEAGFTYGLPVMVTLLAALALAVPLRAPVGSALVCQVRSIVTPAAGCGGQPHKLPGAPRVQRVSDPGDWPANGRAELERRARLLAESYMERFWRTLHGSRHTRIRLRITGNWPEFDGARASRSTGPQPPLDLYLPRQARSRRDFAVAAFIVMHEAGHNGQLIGWPPEHTRIYGEIAYELQADCLAGVSLGWLLDQNQRLVTAEDVPAMEEWVASLPPFPGTHAGGPERLEFFRRGLAWYRSNRNTPLSQRDPFAACL